jgi:hypothetical protein
LRDCDTRRTKTLRAVIYTARIARPGAVAHTARITRVDTVFYTARIKTRPEAALRAAYEPDIKRKDRTMSLVSTT